MDKSEAANTTRNDSSPQLTDYAVNLAGATLHHGQHKVRKLYQRILTRPLCNVSCRRAVPDYPASATAIQKVCRPSLCYTNEELCGVAGHDKRECLVVGFALLMKTIPEAEVTVVPRGSACGVHLPEDASFTYKIDKKWFAPVQKNLDEDNSELPGFQLDDGDEPDGPRAGETHGTDLELTPFIVVTPVSVWKPKVKVKLYVLLEPKDGLCTPYIISADDVFFFHEFRDETGRRRSRFKMWNKLIKCTFLPKSTGQAARSPVSQATLAASSDSDLSPRSNPEMPFASEAATSTPALAANSAHIQDGLLLEELHRAIADMLSNEGRSKSLNNSPRLRQFFYPDIIDSMRNRYGSHGEAQALQLQVPIQLLEDIDQLWPGVAAGHSQSTLNMIRRGIITGRVSVGIKHMEPFLRVATTQINFSMANMDLSGVSCNQAAHFVRIVLSMVMDSRGDMDDKSNRIAIDARALSALASGLRSQGSTDGATTGWNEDQRSHVRYFLNECYMRIGIP